jgi:transcriptional regulator with XRE-family HTH domain
LLRWRSKNPAAQKYNHSGMKNIVGTRVHEARLKFKPPLSQEELAARLELDGWKISRGTLSKIEAGIRQVTDFEVVALAKTLKVSPDWLMDKQLSERMLKNRRG